MAIAAVFVIAAKDAVAAGPGSDDYLPAILRAVVVMAFIGVLIGGVAILRKRLTAAGDDDETPGAFSMGGLRELVRQGKMTPDEFERAKAAVVEATQKRIARDAAKKAEAERKAGQVGRRPAGGVSEIEEGVEGEG